MTDNEKLRDYLPQHTMCPIIPGKEALEKSEALMRQRIVSSGIIPAIEKEIEKDRFHLEDIENLSDENLEYCWCFGFEVADFPSITAEKEIKRLRKKEIKDMDEKEDEEGLIDFDPEL